MQTSLLGSKSQSGLLIPTFDYLISLGARRRALSENIVHAQGSSSDLRPYKLFLRIVLLAQDVDRDAVCLVCERDAAIHGEE